MVNVALSRHDLINDRTVHGLGNRLTFGPGCLNLRLFGQLHFTQCLRGRLAEG